jgi:hypothetical protein
MCTTVLELSYEFRLLCAPVSCMGMQQIASQCVHNIVCIVMVLVSVGQCFNCPAVCILVADASRECTASHCNIRWLQVRVYRNAEGDIAAAKRQKERAEQAARAAGQAPRMQHSDSHAQRAKLKADNVCTCSVLPDQTS